MLDNDLTGSDWDRVVKFHGHACSGLAIGFRTALLARELLNIDDYTEDEGIVCIAESDACGVDAIQVLLKATYGTGSLRVEYKGKQAFSFYNRKNNKSCRIVFKDVARTQDKNERMNKILSLPTTDLFDIKDANPIIPDRASIYESKICSVCNENTAVNAITIVDERVYCIDCLK